MVDVLSTDKQIGIIGSLCEGSSIRSIERIMGVNRDTTMRLGAKVGQGCTALMDAKMQDLPCNRLELDEIWGFVGRKEKRGQASDDPSLGDIWTFCAIPVKETFQGRTVWEGVVEVFELIGHPSATKLYGWLRDTDDPEQPRRHVTLLHTHPIISPLLAVRAAILQEFKNDAPAEA